MLPLLLSLAAQAAAPCPAPTRPAEVQVQLDRANQAFGALDGDGFVASLQDVAVLLPCLASPVSPKLAASWHRTEALRLYTAGDEGAADAFLERARSLQPDHHYPEGQFPEGHPFVGQYEAVVDPEIPTVRVVAPEGHTVRFDGEETLRRPSAHPTLVQKVDPDGKVAETLVLTPDQPYPWGAVPHRRNRLLMAAIGSAVMAGALNGAGFTSRTAFFEPDPKRTRRELDSLQTQTNLFFAGSIAFTAGAAGLGVAALVVREPGE